MLRRLLGTVKIMMLLMQLLHIGCIYEYDLQDENLS